MIDFIHPTGVDGFDPSVDPASLRPYIKRSAKVLNDLRMAIEGSVRSRKRLIRMMENQSPGRVAQIMAKLAETDENIARAKEIAADVSKKLYAARVAIGDAS